MLKPLPHSLQNLTDPRRHSLAKAGVAGLAVHGTTGEPLLLSREERRQVLKTTRESLTAAGFPDFPLIVGTGVTST